MSDTAVMEPAPQHRGDPDKGRLRLWLRLLGSSQTIEKAIRARLRDDHATTLPRFDVMAALDRHPEGLTMGEISRRLRVSGGNVTGVVDRLVREGELRRWHADGDRRSIRIALTERGRATFAELAGHHRAWVEAMLGDLSEAEVETLSALLGRLERSVAAHIGKDQA